MATVILFFPLYIYSPRKVTPTRYAATRSAPRRRKEKPKAVGVGMDRLDSQIGFVYFRAVNLGEPRLRRRIQKQTEKRKKPTKEN